MKFTLRDYQSDIVEQVRHAFRQGYHAPLLQSPTASGKTVIYAYITERAAEMGNSVMILTHRQELLKQTSDALFEMRVPHGLISPKYSASRDKIQVASVQTLVRRLGKYKEPDLIIIDECHHSQAGSWKKILSSYPNAKLLGVTATPIRLDGKGLGVQAGGFFDTLVNGLSVQELIDLGYLSKPVIYAPPQQIDMSALHKQFGDYKQKEVDDLMDKPTITGCAVEHYQKLCPGQPTIVFCASVKHAKHVAEQFNQAGITAESIDGKLNDKDRTDRIQALGNGGIDVLTSCEIISEGTDIPVVSVGILLRPTASTGLFLQQCGRILRIHPDKKCSIILDHVGNTLRHGFPDDDRDWDLAGVKKTKRGSDDDPEINIVQCGCCYLMFRRSEKICPHCGWVVPVQDREIQQVEGELERVERHRKINRKREIGMAKTKEELFAVANERGYNAGWVYHIMNSRKNRKAGMAV